MPRFRLVAALLALSVATSARSDTPSVLSIPITLRYTALKTLVEPALQGALATLNGDEKQTCIEAEQICTNVPEFRGLKIYNRRRCVDITPRIDCTISTRVSVGELAFGGEDGALRLTAPFAGSIGATGRGEIGRHISQTVRFAARLTVWISPAVRPDWQLTAEARHAVHWDQPPVTKLFNLIDITLQSKADKLLNDEVHTYMQTRKQADLDRIALRDRLGPIWSQIQAPIRVALPGGDALHLHLRPENVAMAPLGFDDTGISTRLSVSGRFVASDSESHDVAPTDLPPLSAEPPPEGLALVVPVSLRLSSLTTAANATLPQHLPFAEPFSGSITLQDVTLEEAPEGRLLARMTAQVALRLWPAVTLPLVLSGRPDWDADSRILALADPELTFSAGWPIGSALDALAASPAGLARLSKALEIQLGPLLDELNSGLVEALDSGLGAGMGADGTARLSVADLRLDNGLRLTLRADGAVALTLRDLR